MALQTEIFQMLTSNRVLSCIIFVYLYYGPFLYMSLCQHVIFPGRKGNAGDGDVTSITCKVAAIGTACLMSVETSRVRARVA